MQITYQKHTLSSLTTPAPVSHALAFQTPLGEFSQKPLPKAGTVIMRILLPNKGANITSLFTDSFNKHFLRTFRMPCLALEIRRNENITRRNSNISTSFWKGLSLSLSDWRNNLHGSVSRHLWTQCPAQTSFFGMPFRWFRFNSNHLYLHCFILHAWRITLCMCMCACMFT